MLNVVVPGKAEVSQLCLELEADGEDEGNVGGQVEVFGPEEGEGFAKEKDLDFVSNLGCDGSCIEHSVVIRRWRNYL